MKEKSLIINEIIYQRDSFRCVYCGKYLFDNIDNWQICEIDHLITDQTNYKNINVNDPKYRVTSCRVCNCYRSNWSPDIELNDETRQEYIDRIRTYIFNVRSKKMVEFFSSLQRLGLLNNNIIG